jgi:hypothetical protein
MGAISLSSLGIEQSSVSSGVPAWVVLGVAASKRARGLLAAARERGVEVRLVEWFDWMNDASVLERELRRPCRFKIEPPGDDVRVQRWLVQMGCERLGRAPAQAERSELADVDAWFVGLQVVMQRLESMLAKHPGAEVANAPADILAMTDKLACQQRLQSHSVPTAALLGPVTGYEQFVALLDRHGLDRAFVKARYGSSAAGVVAFRRNRRGQQQATTTAHLHEGTNEGASTSLGAGARLFNVKRSRRYTHPAELRRVIDLVAAQGAYAEAWIAKPRCGDGHFDVRMVTFAGRCAHRVARVSARPMTNLHLDSRRVDPREVLGSGDMHALERVAERAAAAFPRSHMIGFDLVARRGEAFVLEANAFGDLLPGLLWEGRDTYSAAFDARVRD